MENGSMDSLLSYCYGVKTCFSVDSNGYVTTSNDVMTKKVAEKNLEIINKTLDALENHGKFKLSSALIRR